MPRVKRGFKLRRRHKRILKMAKGMRNARSRLFRTAREQVFRGLKIAFKERRRKKREYRSLWIVRINAAVRALGSKYSEFAGWLTRSGVGLDRKALADLALHDMDAFKAVFAEVRAKGARA
ncbi:MAG: 50S ribosomal protein L20 [Myxococcales bacterium]|nr:50S ribosomal protein L20 [Myxococcales bacterium]